MSSTEIMRSAAKNENVFCGAEIIKKGTIQNAANESF